MTIPVLTTLDGIMLISILLDMERRGVPAIERRWVCTLVRQQPARWNEPWTDPMLGRSA